MIEIWFRDEAIFIKKNSIILILFIFLILFVFYLFVERRILSVRLKKINYNKNLEKSSKSILNTYQTRVLRNLALLIAFFGISFKLAEELKKERKYIAIILIFSVMIFLTFELLFLETERKALMRISGLNETVNYMERELYGYGFPFFMRWFIGHSLSIMVISIFILLLLHLTRKHKNCC